MAYYQNAPSGRKPKKNYAETGSWDEEGTHYRDGNRNRRSGAESRTRLEDRKYAAQGERRRTPGRSEDRRSDRYAAPGRSEDRRNERYAAPGRNEERRGERYVPPRRDDRRDPERKNSGPAFSRGPREDAFRKPRPAEEPPRGYQNFEYRKPEERPQTHEEADDHILCGRNPIREALRGGREIEKLLVQKGELSGSAREIVQEAREKKIMVQEVDKRRLDEIALHHQGLIAFASAYHYAEVEEMLEEAARREEDPFLVILDGVTDPHNLGAVIRTAECAGAHGVIIPVHRSVGLTPAAVKASAGAIEHMKVARVVNLNRTIEELKRAGVWTYAVTMDGKDYEKVDFHGGTALVIGAEGEGISRLTAEKCDLSVSLPMKGALDSLNASVAAGIMMYRVLSCRRRG